MAKAGLAISSCPRPEGRG